MVQTGRSLLVRRTGAFLIDHLIVVFLIVMTFFLVLNPSSSDIYSMSIRIITLLVVAYVLYCCKDIVNGRSIGKRFFGIAVRNDNNNPPSIGKLVLRNLFTFIWPMEILFILVSKQKRKLGDHLSKSDVYLIKANKSIVGIIFLIASIIAIFICIMIFGILQIIKSDSSYKFATQYIKSNPKIKQIVGNDITIGYFPSGGVHYENGYGSSDFRIKVMGNYKTIFVHISLTKEPNSNWTVNNIKY